MTTGTGDLAAKADSFTRDWQSVRAQSDIQFTPVKIPLFPGYNTQETAWSEIRYTAYSFVRPRFSVRQ